MIFVSIKDALTAWIIISYGVNTFVTLTSLASFHSFFEQKGIAEIKWRAIIVLSGIVYSLIAYMYEVGLQSNFFLLSKPYFYFVLNF